VDSWGSGVGRVYREIPKILRADYVAELGFERGAYPGVGGFQQ
jgi:hypothetical protein